MKRYCVGKLGFHKKISFKYHSWSGFPPITLMLKCSLNTVPSKVQISMKFFEDVVYVITFLNRTPYWKCTKHYLYVLSISFKYHSWSGFPPITLMLKCSLNTVPSKVQISRKFFEDVVYVITFLNRTPYWKCTKHYLYVLSI
jgi:hypothetical protein